MREEGGGSWGKEFRVGTGALFGGVSGGAGRAGWVGDVCGMGAARSVQ